MGDMVRETPNADLSGDLVSQPKESFLIGVLFHQKDEIGECEEKKGEITQKDAKRPVKKKEKIENKRKNQGKKAAEAEFVIQHHLLN